MLLSRCCVTQVMKVVKSLATVGITVIATIHSPTPVCFNLFDRLLLLLRGNIIYFGPNGGCWMGAFGGLAGSSQLRGACWYPCLLLGQPLAVGRSTCSLSMGANLRQLPSHAALQSAINSLSR
jgi:hypothetical protein